MAIGRTGLAVLVAASLVAAAGLARTHAQVGEPHAARLTARPGPGGANCSPGTHTLHLGPGRKALMRVGRGGTGGRRPLLVALHGYGGASSAGLWIFRGGWDRRGLVVVAAAAESQGWNPFLGSDLNPVDRALKRAFARCRIDRRRIAVGGHSDGAGNALTFGLSNGDLFDAVIAIAPAGVIVQKAVGKPRVLVAHGSRDRVIPPRMSDEVVRRLRSSGYRVTYRRFAGGHEVPLGVSQAAIRWFLG